MQPGDQVMMLRNDARIGIRNGNRGVSLVVDPDQRTMRVRLPRGEVDLSTRYLDAGHVGLVYAITVMRPRNERRPPDVDLDGAPMI